jgi:hypothetical protein
MDFVWEEEGQAMSGFDPPLTWWAKAECLTWFLFLRLPEDRKVIISHFTFQERP